MALMTDPLLLGATFYAKMFAILNGWMTISRVDRTPTLIINLIF